MSRSTMHGAPRESVWPAAVPSSTYLSHLEDCISATENCVHSLSSTLERLQPGISDFPRLTKVLVNKHRFLVLPNSTVQTHLAALADSLTPQINNLISRANELVEAERARITSMEETVRILKQGPSTGALSSSASASASASTGQDGVGEEDVWGDKLAGLEMGGMGVAQMRRVTMLRNRRDRIIKSFADAGLALPTGPSPSARE